MLLHGAIVPPPSRAEAVADVVRSVSVVEPVGAAERTGLLGRLGRRARSAEPEPPGPPALEFAPLEQLYFPITSFGNLTSGDAQRLVGALAEAAQDWASVPVRFAGGAALEFPGDWSVWAKLDGDLDAVNAIARGVTQRVEGLGFFVDRRIFRPMMAVATVTPATTGEHLEAVVGALDAFVGEEWALDHVMVTTASYDQGSRFTPFRRIDLA